MPTAPSLPPEMMQQLSQGGGGGAMPTSPANFLMAAADLHQQGQLSAPVPPGHALQTGKPIAKARGKTRIQVVK